jgi:hypothetical protein
LLDTTSFLNLNRYFFAGESLLMVFGFALVLTFGLVTGVGAEFVVGAAVGFSIGFTTGETVVLVIGVEVGFAG